MKQGVLPTPSSDGSGVTEGRAATGEQDTGVRELELQIDALYNVPSNSGGATGTAPFRVIQTPVVRSHLHLFHFPGNVQSGLRTQGIFLVFF